VIASVDARYLPFLEGPRELAQASFRWRLGVRPLDLRDWIELGDGADEAIAAKRRLSIEYPTTVFAALDGVEDESRQVADALVEHLRTRFPDRYREVVLDAALHPLDAVARLVPEDLVLMVERDGRLVFGAGSVCFPNRWDLRSKLGRTLSEVHEPVALLNEQLEGPIDRFFDRLTPQRCFWRLGWGVLDTADWYTPIDGTAAPRPLSPSPDQLFLRVERETLRRFPVTNAVLFTIRTYVTPISTIADDPLLAGRLADALNVLPDSVQAYKDVASFGPALVEHLRHTHLSHTDLSHTDLSHTDLSHTEGSGSLAASKARNLDSV
jgi:dimethylamine monooxygenase subunit A